MIALDGGTKGDRVWCDGCYDMVHFGHANQLRQAKLFGKKLIVGVHNDEEVLLHKGPPVFNEQERYRMVEGIKWVDEVVEDAPYATTIETLNRYDCDFCVHGDDITLMASGRDTYEEVKNAKRYRECKRTAGISTTDLVGRMLLLTKSHHAPEECIEKHKERVLTLSTDCMAQSPWTRVSRFITSTQTILEFAEGRRPKPTDKIVYVCGAFDLFHIGHLLFLEESAKLGDYLIVGILSDQVPKKLFLDYTCLFLFNNFLKVVNDYKGGNHPIMSLHERVLSVLAYKPVNEVVSGAPYVITDDFINRFKISLVCQGTRVPHHNHSDTDPFKAAKRRGFILFTIISF
uniref:ethanolamine-phosphate cytidylyltransferase n=1 Tax=Heterorhabditis bacteriophora TaxID=37862 RepID=A0A1I7XAV1_HETBA